MKSKSLVLAGFSAIALGFSSIAFANNSILCPPINLIKQTAGSLSYVQETEQPGRYVVITPSASLTYSDKNWYVGVVITANSKSDALAKAQDNVQNAVSQIDQEAQMIKDYYVCVSQGKVAPIMALANIGNGSATQADILATIK